MYLDYQAYQTMGGDLDNSAFTKYNRKAEYLIKSQAGGKTGLRIGQLSELPQAVIDCTFDLISHLATLPANVASESQSLGGQSESKSYFSKENLDEETLEIIHIYLYPIKLDGYSILYKGDIPWDIEHNVDEYALLLDNLSKVGEEATEAVETAKEAAGKATEAVAQVEKAVDNANNAVTRADNAAEKAEKAIDDLASSAASVNPNNYYKKSETYSKTEVNKQFAARSSANSANDSSVRFSQCLWNKGNDDGTDSYVMVDDAKPANDVYLWSSQKTMSAVEENVTDTINRYKTNEFQYNYAARSSPNSGSASSVASAKGLWVKADDTGESGTAELQDSLKSSDKVLWSSKKTDEEIKKQSNLLCNALKGSKSGSAVQIDDVSPTNGELKVSVASKNLVPYPSYTSRTSNGITATVNSDGSITLNGTNTGTAASTFTLVSKFSLDKIIYNYSGGTFIDSAKTYYVNLTIDTHKDNKWVKTFGNMGNASGTQIDNSEGLYDDGTISLSITKGATVTDFVIKPQLEIGTSRTEYTPHISDLSSVTVKAYETDPTDIKATYTPNEDGTVEGVTAISPTTTLTTDNSGVVLNCEYNRDINKAFAELQQAIISLGGNV